MSKILIVDDDREIASLIGDSLYDAGYDVKKQPKNWLESFEALKDVIRLSSEKKKIIFIDELSWIWCYTR